jgi:hypothetical protein
MMSSKAETPIGECVAQVIAQECWQLFNAAVKAVWSGVKNPKRKLVLGHPSRYWDVLDVSLYMEWTTASGRVTVAMQLDRAITAECSEQVFLEYDGKGAFKRSVTVDVTHKTTRENLIAALKEEIAFQDKKPEPA